MRYHQILKGSNSWHRDLLQLIQRDYSFLEKDYEMRRVSIEDGYTYTNASTIVYVRNWEEPWVGIDQRLSPYEKDLFGFPIWSIMRVANSQYLYNDYDVIVDKFQVYALALAECGDSMLRGNFNLAPALVNYLKKRQE